MIVRQEERVLGACLKSIREANCVDCICITDTGSTDRTVSIAKEYGAIISHFTWCDSFSAARNYSFAQAPPETAWRFWCDADDTIPIECGAKLRESVLLAEGRTMGIIVPVHIPPQPGEYGYTVCDHVKLIRSVKNHECGQEFQQEYQWESRIHEQIMDPITRTGGRIERSEAYVVHSGYDYSPEGQLRKRARDEKLLALDELERPTASMPKWNSGMTAFFTNDFSTAVEKLEQCLALSQPQESTVHKCYAMLGGAYFEMGNLDRAREYLDTGLAMFPENTEILFRSAGLYRDLGDLSAAERLYLRLLAPRSGSGVDSLDVTMGTFKGHHNLGSVYLSMQRHADAERCFRIALQQCPSFVPAWQMLVKVYLQMRRFDDAREVQRKLAEFSAEAAAALGREIMAGQ
jgi:glycosyltransferase involved in cell wall biosynthesis